MFFAVLIIALGLAIFLNTLGVMSGSFWGFFWAIFFIAAGVRMMMRRGKCPICGWRHWEGKMHGKMHEKMGEHCCDHNHQNEEQK